MSFNIVIIGSTGILGSKLLDFTFRENINVYAITCYKNKKLINYQKKKFRVKHSFVLSESDDQKSFLKFLKLKIDLIYFLDFGSFSLLYLNQFIKHNTNSIVGIANKEMIIAGGKLLFTKLKKTKNIFIPLDSEHYSLKNYNFNNDIEKVFITASGGPFFFSKKKSLNNVKIEDAIAHPKWKMGINNSLDSSNFINKLLEIYELSYIYNLGIDKIDFLVSREAFVHSIIHFKDGIISINSFNNDMLIPLINPLKAYYDINYTSIGFKNIFNHKNFILTRNYDSRFIFFKYYKKFRNFNHSQQIKLLLLNNHAQSLYLSKKLKYHEIIPYIMKKINKYPDMPLANSLNQIVNYIENLKNEIFNA